MSKQVFQTLWETDDTTPLLKINQVLGDEEFAGNIYAKIESRNPTGKFTDRIAKAFYQNLVDQKKLTENKCLVDVYKKNLTLSFSSRAVKAGNKVVVFYDSTADSKEIKMLGYLGVQLHECCGKREVLREMNDFLDNNNCVNISEEFQTQKSEIKIEISKEIQQ